MALRNSMDLAASSWAVLKADKELLLLPLISTTASLITAASFFLPIVTQEGGLDNLGGSSFLLMIPVYFILAFITIFFNAALISAAHERLEGGDPTIGSALRGAGRRAGKILSWALISATVSVVLSLIEERLGFIGSIVVALLEVAWTVVTFLVLPIIVIEDLASGDAVRKSGKLLRSTWGENLTAQAGMGMIGFLLILPAAALIWAGVAGGGEGGVYAVGLGAVWGVAVVVFMAALSGVYQTALYHFAAHGRVPSRYFSRSVLESAFKPKRRWWKRNR